MQTRCLAQFSLVSGRHIIHVSNGAQTFLLESVSFFLKHIVTASSDALHSELISTASHSEPMCSFPWSRLFASPSRLRNGFTKCLVLINSDFSQHFEGAVLLPLSGEKSVISLTGSSLEVV